MVDVDTFLTTLYVYVMVDDFCTLSLPADRHPAGDLERVRDCLLQQGSAEGYDQIWQETAQDIGVFLGNDRGLGMRWVRRDMALCVQLYGGKVCSQRSALGD